MGRKALFVLALAVWLSSRAVPTVAGAAESGYCGDGNCDSLSCSHYPGDPGDGCEENAGNCDDCVINPCSLPPNPFWVTDWGTNQQVGGYSYLTYDPWQNLDYCQYRSTNTVEQYQTTRRAWRSESPIARCAITTSSSRIGCTIRTTYSLLQLLVVRRHWRLLPVSVGE